MYSTIYVDDIIIACTNVDSVREIKTRFCSTFDMSDMGELVHFLNVRVTRTSSFLQLDVGEVLRFFGTAHYDQKISTSQ